MTKPTLPLTLPASLKAAATRLAKEDGVSLDQWITVAVAQKVGAVETLAVFFEERARGAQPQDLRSVLARIPDVPADEGDGLSPEFDHIPAERLR